LEALRYLPYLADDGWIISNKTPFKNIPNYPDVDAIYKEVTDYKKHVLIDGDAIAKEINSPRSMNVVILGAAIDKIGFSQQEIEDAIRTTFAGKGDKIVNANLLALQAGIQAK